MTKDAGESESSFPAIETGKECPFCPLGHRCTVTTLRNRVEIPA